MSPLRQEPRLFWGPSLLNRTVWCKEGGGIFKKRRRRKNFCPMHGESTEATVWCMGHQPALLFGQNAVGPSLQVQRLNSGLWGAPGPEEALRVLKWPLILSQTQVLAASSTGLRPVPQPASQHGLLGAKWLSAWPLILIYETASEPRLPWELPTP